VLTLYLVTTSLYSFWLKKRVIVDVILLASLYTLRIIAGAAATTIVPSFWLLAFSMFVFLSLAIVKRYSELSLVKDETQLLAGRGYLKSDLPVLSALGVGSGLMSVMVLALYIDSVTAETAYREPVWLWLATPIMLYWVARLWMKTHRGEIHDDPVLFAATDRQSLAIAPVLGLIFIAASQGWRFW
jgi:4-hydroxybenzoate polyprenyltransferase